MHSWHIPPCKNSVGCCQKNCCSIAPSNMTVLFEGASPRSMQDVSALPMARLLVCPELWATWCLSRMMLVANLASSCHWLCHITRSPAAVDCQYPTSPSGHIYCQYATFKVLLAQNFVCFPVFIEPHCTNRDLSKHRLSYNTAQSPQHSAPCSKLHAEWKGHHDKPIFMVTK
jgi:hypothetical protein